MKVELVVATGNPASPGAGGANWTLTPTVFLVRFNFDARWRIGWFFTMFQMLGLAADDIMVVSVDDNLSAGTIDRIREVRDKMMPGRMVCLLDNNVLLANLSNAQILARIG